MLAQDKINDTMRIRHKAYKSAHLHCIKAKSYNLDASLSSVHNAAGSSRGSLAEAPMKFGVTEASLVPINEGLADIVAYSKGLRY